jgi:hypothetical protein
MLFDFAGLMPGMDSLTVQDTAQFISIKNWVLANGFAESNPFSLEWDDNGNKLVVDAAANAVLKIDNAGMFSVLDTFPAIPNTFTPFPPTIDYVPTKILSDMNGSFYVCNLTGFPFVPQISSVVMIDTAGNVTPKFQGLSQAVDMEMDSTGILYVLQFGAFDTTGPVFNSASIVRIQTDGTMDTVASGFGPSGGFVRDTTPDGFYATELLTGNVIHIANTTTGLSTPEILVNSLSAFPNPFNDKINVRFNLNADSDVMITITDQNGKLVYGSDNLYLGKGSHEQMLDLTSADVAAGIYFISVKSGHSVNTINILRK